MNHRDLYLQGVHLMLARTVIGGEPVIPSLMPFVATGIIKWTLLGYVLVKTGKMTFPSRKSNRLQPR